MSATLSSSIVARISYLTSDVLVDVKPALPQTSFFAETYASLAKTSHHQLTLLPLPAGADAGATLLRHESSQLVSLTAISSPQLVSRLILHLADLKTTPAVLHLGITSDLSDVLLLRTAAPFFLLSCTPQQTHENALLSARLARQERKSVIHAFYVGRTDDPAASNALQEISESEVHSLLHGEAKSSTSVQNGQQASGYTNGYTNGHTNGTNGHANGGNEINGYSNGLNGSASPKHTVPDDLPWQASYKAYELAASSVVAVTRRPLLPVTVCGSSEPHTVILVVGDFVPQFDVEGVKFVQFSLLNPLLPSRILDVIPPSATRVLVLEHLWRWSMKWTPLYLDVAGALQRLPGSSRPFVSQATLGETETINQVDVLKLIQRAFSSSSDAPSASLVLGREHSLNGITPNPPIVPRHELSYTKILSHLFGDRLDIANSPTLVETHGEIATNPEFALGRVRGQLAERAELLQSVQQLVQSNSVDPDLHSLLSRWSLAKEDPLKSHSLGLELVEKVRAAKGVGAAGERIISLRSHLPARSRWIIGSDAWSYDLGASGLHHAIASGLNVNILILDTLPYTARNAADSQRRKHDVGLYAMNHGDVYVASVAVYSSYSQVLQALVEADRFEGPSVVLAYLPYQSETTPALDVLKETKLAVDAGYWPLYRWNPAKEREGKEPFSLDSDAIKNELQQFLDRQNHLSQLVRSKPQLAAELVSSLGENVKEARRRHAQKLYEDMLTNIDAPPLSIFYASDGGAAEKVAKRLGKRAKARGLSATVGTIDSTSLDDLAQEEYVVFVTSTAGQGEPPQNGRTFFKALNAAATQNSISLPKLQFSVFAMGDSHYWPRVEDAHYYNKPGKDLFARLKKLGGQPIAELGLGDDQDADGPETGYKIWEPLIWKALGVDSIEITEAEPDPITNEHIKAASLYLRGTISEGLADATTGALAVSDTQLTKFHGIYQQDDRDIRDERQAQGVEPAYSFMIRVRMPGGVCTPAQWLQMDQIADEHGSGTFKITTRQTFQFHGVIKRHLKPAIQDINRVLLDTLAACGDVNRNVICSSIPTLSKLHAQVYEFSKSVSEHLIPRTTAYHEIWLDKKLVAGEALKDFEPLYGEFYLPRKFKIAVAVPPTNDVDVFANDLGFIAIVDSNGELAGFNVTIGGGMGVTHGNKKTYPRTADVIGLCTVDQGKYVAEKVMLVQRDNGNRADRKVIHV
ncbi:hypothetical protein HGRIS_004701 [Hohenbuehelia grisea]|uniref:Flavodoxin-like domain-containing protein n=1 Tax=Hohenbuehelia grisea TaxID=104357 RepID=A0ABR3JCW0_9AGAR